MATTLYQSRLEAIGDALAERIRTAPALLAESADVVSRVDDEIGSMIEARVGKSGGLLVVVALLSLRPLQEGAAGPRVRVSWVATLWSRRATRRQRNSGPVLLEALLARVQGWMPDGDELCYDAFSLVSAEQVAHEKFTVYRATFSSSVTLRAPVPAADEEES